MNEIQTKVKQAQRRLWFNRWLATLGWCLAGAAVAFIVVVLLDRLWLALQPTGRWIGLAAATLSGAALIASFIWTAVTRDSLSLAAARLDEAGGLKERLSTGLYCTQSSDPFARAVLADAMEVSRGVSVHQHLPVRVPGSANYAGATLLVALLFFWLFPAVDLAGKQAAREEQQEKQDAVKREAAQVRPLVDKALQDLKTKHPELAKDLPPLEALEPAKMDNPTELRQAAMKQINAVTKSLEERKNDGELGKVEDFKKMLRRLAAEPTPKSPVGELAKALAKGDLQSAQSALDKVKQALDKEPKTPEEKQQADQLKQQLKQLSDQINKAAENQKQTQNELAKAGMNQEEVNKAMQNMEQGKMEEVAKQLAQKGLSKKDIDSLMKKCQQCQGAQQAAKKLAQNLAQAGQPGKGEQGQQGQGAQGEGESLTAAAQQLSEMESMQEQLNELAASMANMNSLKDSLCQGGNPSQFGDPNKRGPGMGNLGQGEGGIAPEEETATGLKAQRSKVHTAAGSIIAQQEFEGEQIKGEATQDFVDTVLSARQDIKEATNRKNIPTHIKRRQADYFSHVDKMLPADKVEKAKEKLQSENP